MKHLESEQQKIFAIQLRQMERLGCFKHLPFFKFTAIPDMGKRTPAQGKRNKDMGYLAGWPDISLVWKSGEYPKIGFLEFKSETIELGKRTKGALSDSQKTFKADCDAAGILYEVVYSANDAFEVLKLWGVIR